jgi:hypothetical protein
MTSDHSSHLIDNELKPKRARHVPNKAAPTPVEGDCTICFENYKNDYAVLNCVRIFPNLFLFKNYLFIYLSLPIFLLSYVETHLLLQMHSRME